MKIHAILCCLRLCDNCLRQAICQVESFLVPGLEGLTARFPQKFITQTGFSLPQIGSLLSTTQKRGCRMVLGWHSKGCGVAGKGTLNKRDTVAPLLNSLLSKTYGEEGGVLPYPCLGS